MCMIISTKLHSFSIRTSVHILECQYFRTRISLVLGLYSSVHHNKKALCVIATFPNNFVRICREKAWQMEIQSSDKTFLPLKHI